jgi:hypothetical protein
MEWSIDKVLNVIFIRDTMDNVTSLKPNYCSPIVRVIPMALENALCGSPVPGGNEDIGYDDWN